MDIADTAGNGITDTAGVQMRDTAAATVALGYQCLCLTGAG